MKYRRNAAQRTVAVGTAMIDTTSVTVSSRRALSSAVWRLLLCAASSGSEESRGLLFAALNATFKSAEAPETVARAASGRPVLTYGAECGD